MKNTVEIKNNIVCKTYASRLDFVKEESLYKKLKGSGLAPELYDSHDGYLEHEYVQGKSYLEVIKESADNLSILEDLFSMFFEWYKKYRELTKLTLGQVRFEKFIIIGDRLCNLDFEHTKPGYLEDDIARLIAQIYFDGKGYKEHDYTMVRFLMYVAAKNIEYSSELLYDRIKKEIINEAKVLSLPVNETEMEFLATALTSAGIVFAGGDKALSDLADRFRLLPQRIVSVAKGRGMATLDDFAKVQSYVKANERLKRMVDAQRYVNQAWTVCVTAEMPKIPELLWTAILSAEKEDYAAIMIEANGKLRTFPLLLNTAKTKFELDGALRANEKTTLKEALSKMKIQVIKVENIGNM